MSHVKAAVTATSDSSGRASTAPIRIGLLSAKGGPLAPGGLQLEYGIGAFLKERHSQLAGRRAELVLGQTTGAGGRTGDVNDSEARLRELVEDKKVSFLLGPLSRIEVMAMSSYVKAHKVPQLLNAASENMTQRMSNPWWVRTMASWGQCCHPLGHYAATELKMKRVATIGEDFDGRYEQTSAFLRVFEENGGKVVKKIWTPNVVSDFSRFMEQIRDVDGIFNGLSPENSPVFIKQYAQHGLQNKIPMIGGHLTIDDPALKDVGDAALGVISASFCTSDYASPGNERLVASVLKESGNLPGIYAVGTYLNGMCIEAALEKTHGNIDDRDALMRALREVSIEDSPRGPFHFDEFGNAVGNVFIREVQRKDGKLVNRIVKTYENVSQFWTYDHQQFLADPLYSRDYPPAKYLE